MTVSIQVDGVEIMQISDPQIKLLQYRFNKTTLKNLLIDKLKDIMQSEINYTLRQLKEDWIPIINTRYATISTSDAQVAQLIFSQPDYKDYDQRNA